MPVAAPPEVRAAAVAGYLAGQSCKEVGAALGVSPTAVSKWVIQTVGKGHPRPQLARRGCDEEGCSGDHAARGYCRTHYGQHFEGRVPQNVPLLEDIEWLAETGESWEGAIMRLGVLEQTLQRRLVRLGRYDLVVQLKRRDVIL